MYSLTKSVVQVSLGGRKRTGVYCIYLTNTMKLLCSFCMSVTSLVQRLHGCRGGNPKVEEVILISFLYSSLSAEEAGEIWAALLPALVLIRL